MKVTLHANATTTPKVRAYIQSSPASVTELAMELGVSKTTIRRWKNRDDTGDRSHRPLKIQTRFDAVEEEIAIELRRRIGLSLDDCLEVMRRCLRPDISRSALHRCFKRHGLSARTTAPRPAVQHFEPTPFGYVHCDLKYLPKLEQKAAYAFVAIERTTSFVHVEIIQDRSAKTVAACLKRFLTAFGYPVHTILTDNGSEFTDRFGDARWRKRNSGTGNHPFDLICKANGIKHKLTRPYRPQTNGKVERFNRRLGEALKSAPSNGENSGRNKFSTHSERNKFIMAFVDNYNRTRLRCLRYKAPREALNNLPGKAGTQEPPVLRFLPLHFLRSPKQTKQAEPRVGPGSALRLAGVTRLGKGKRREAGGSRVPAFAGMTGGVALLLQILAIPFLLPSVHAPVVTPGEHRETRGLLASQSVEWFCEKRQHFPRSPKTWPQASESREWAPALRYAWPG